MAVCNFIALLVLLTGLLSSIDGATTNTMLVDGLQKEYNREKLITTNSTFLDADYPNSHVDLTQNNGGRLEFQLLALPQSNNYSKLFKREKNLKKRSTSIARRGSLRDHKMSRSEERRLRRERRKGRNARNNSGKHRNHHKEINIRAGSHSDGLYTNWSRWTRCNRKCKQKRRRKCKKKDICGNAIIKEERFCTGWKCKRKPTHNNSENIISAESTGRRTDSNQESDGSKHELQMVSLNTHQQLMNYPNPTDSQSTHQVINIGRNLVDEFDGKKQDVLESSQIEETNKTFKVVRGRKSSHRDVRLHLNFNTMFYSRWSDWSDCTPSCTTSRYRWCKYQLFCSGAIVREEAYCYSPGDHCEEKYMMQESNFPHNDDRFGHFSSSSDNHNIFHESNEPGPSSLFSDRNIFDDHFGILEEHLGSFDRHGIFDSRGTLLESISDSKQPLAENQYPDSNENWRAQTQDNPEMSGRGQHSHSESNSRHINQNSIDHHSSTGRNVESTPTRFKFESYEDERNENDLSDVDRPKGRSEVSSATFVETPDRIVSASSSASSSSDMDDIQSSASIGNSFKFSQFKLPSVTSQYSLSSFPSSLSSSLSQFGKTSILSSPESTTNPSSNQSPNVPPVSYAVSGILNQQPDQTNPEIENHNHLVPSLTEQNINYTFNINSNNSNYYRPVSLESTDPYYYNVDQNTVLDNRKPTDASAVFAESYAHNKVNVDSDEYDAPNQFGSSNSENDIHFDFFPYEVSHEHSYPSSLPNTDASSSQTSSSTPFHPSSSHISSSSSSSSLNSVCGVSRNGHPHHKRRHRGSRISLRILGGREAQRGQWPWQVVILNRYKEPFCGGVIIGPQWVLTAAHCIRKRLYVRLAEHDLTLREGTELEFRITATYPHPLYDTTTVDNDVALLQLPRPIDYTPYIAPVCLPPQGETLPVGRLCTIIGWGKERNSHLFGTDVLHQAEVPIINSAACRREYWDYHITRNMFCAGYKGGRVDSCAGDSGGPLLCQVENSWYVYGITSFGEGCGREGKYGIYARVSNYHSWIGAVMDAHSLTENGGMDYERDHLPRGRMSRSHHRRRRRH